jgi:hypothetical protein
VTDARRMIREAECDETADPNPIANGRFKSIRER